MADIQILSAHIQDGRIVTLEVQFYGTKPRQVDRDTAVTWVREGHSLMPVYGHGHDVTRGSVVSLAEVDDAAYLRTDTKAVAADLVTFPGH